MSNTLDINMTVSPDEPEAIISLLQEYVGGEWLDPDYSDNLSGEQLEAIWLQKKEEIMDRNMINSLGNQIFSENNNIFKTSSKDDFLENWIFNIYTQLQSGNPDWEIVRINLGDTEEDGKEFDILKKIYDENPEDAIFLYEDLMNEELEQQAKSFIGRLTAQNSLVSKQELIDSIIGGEDLTRTTYGPIDDSAKLESNFDASIVNGAIQDANKFSPVSDKQIYIMDTGDSGPYGVVETELQAKIAKLKILKELESYPDQLTDQETNEIIQKLNAEMNKGAIAFRVNPIKISLTVEELMSQVKEGAIAAGLEHLLPEMYNQTLSLAIGSVIAHEGEHTTKMTSREGDPDNESRAEGTENRFIDEMLKEEKYKTIRPVINRRGKELSEQERQFLISELQNSENIENSPTTENLPNYEYQSYTAHNRSWYKVVS